MAFILAADVQVIPPSGIPPLPNKGACLVYNSSGVLYAFGGHRGTDKVQDEIFVFDLKSNFWEESIPFSSVMPTKRFGSGCFIKDQFVVIFGGTTIFGTERDLWAYDTQWNKWEEIKIENSPSYRYYFAFSSFNRSENYTFAIFGGYKKIGVSSGLYL